MKNLILLFILLCLNTLGVFAQHEADNWYFGEYAGISFKTGSPVAISDGKLNTLEGCATVSDKITGDLLFYTDGVTIWNSKHEIMDNGNGLNGGPSSTQSALIVPNPANKFQYYVFTTPDLSSGAPIPSTTSFFYSIVSMEVPFGTVISKNNFLIDSIAEKVTGTIDCSGKGFWVVTHHVRKSIFYSFHVTSSGINSVPTVSPYISDTKDFRIGCIKISPNSSKIALASVSGISCLSLFDFDAMTGEVMNCIPLNDLKKGIFYGLSFSPDNTKLYAPDALSRILQYEVNLLDSTAIRNSAFPLKSNLSSAEGMQIAPDGKIYIAQVLPSNRPYLSVIDNPNLKGNSCSYREDAFLLTGKCREGVPNFMDYIFNTEGIPIGSPSCTSPQAIILSDSTCIGNSLVFTDHSISASPINREWVFENGNPASSKDSIATVTYSQPGTYNVRLIASNENGSDTTFTDAIIFPLPPANAGEDKSICLPEVAQLGSPAESGNSYSWIPIAGLSNASVSNPVASPKLTTEYILTVTSSNGCVNYDTTVVTVTTSDEHLFILNPSTITILPGEQFQVSLKVPTGVQSWKLHLSFDTLIVKFNAILQTTKGITATVNDLNGQLTISGNGENGEVLLNFNAFLPYNFDTTFVMVLTKDSLETNPCGTITTLGATLELGLFCARKFRIIRSTGKNYFLTSKANGINFGVGLPGRVRLELYDYTGTLKEVLQDGDIDAGEYSLDFELPTGVYFCRINAGMYNDVQKIMILEH